MVESKYRGHNIKVVGSKWVYSDTLKNVDKNKYRMCGICNKPNTKEGHDPCLGHLPGLMNACCGHGQEAEAYIQFLDGFCVRGANALAIVNILKQTVKK